MVDSCHLLLSKFYIVLLDPAFAAVPGQVEQVLDATGNENAFYVFIVHCVGLSGH